MIAWLRTRIDSFLGQGDAAVTVPPMDGALSPNTRLDRADLIAQIPTPNDIAQGDATYVSSGNTVYRLGPAGTTEPFRHFAEPVTSLAAQGDRLAVGQPNHILLLQGVTETTLPVPCPTALAFMGDTLIATQGSSHNTPAQWKHDLMQRGSSGPSGKSPPAARQNPSPRDLHGPTASRSPRAASSSRKAGATA